MRTISEQENIRRILRHECPQWIPEFRKECTGDMIPPEIAERAPGDGTMAQMHGGEGFDWFGVRWIFQSSVNGSTVDPNCPPVLQDITQWEREVKFPDLEAIDWPKVAARYEEGIVPGKCRQLTILNGPFERLHALMGMEEALCALLAEPEATAELLHAIAAFKMKLIEKVAAYLKPDFLDFHDDWGHGRNSFFSVQTFCDLLVPPMQSIVSHCEKHGMFYTHHSCGYVTNLIPVMVEEIGIKTWSSAQSVNDIPGIVRKYADRFTVIGGCDYPFLETQGREEAKRFLSDYVDDLCRGGAFIPLLGSQSPVAKSVLEELLAQRGDFFEIPANREYPWFAASRTSE